MIVFSYASNSFSDIRCFVVFFERNSWFCAIRGWNTRREVTYFLKLYEIWKKKTLQPKFLNGRYFYNKRNNFNNVLAISVRCEMFAPGIFKHDLKSNLSVVIISRAYILQYRVNKAIIGLQYIIGWTCLRMYRVTL